MRLEFKIILIVYFFGIICSVLSKAGDVIFVSIMARHGARTPTWFYANDKNKNNAAWKQGAGVLTMLGREQTHDLGLWLHKRYGHLLTSPDKIFVETTDVDRVKQSAQCCLAGMFSTHGGSTHGGKDVDCKTSVQLHFKSSNEDHILAGRAPCKAYTDELERVYKSKEIETKNEKFKHVYQTIYAKSGSKGRQGERVDFIHKIYDTILVEEEFHLKPDQWAVDLMKPMKQAAILSFTIPTWNDKLKRLKMGPLIGKIIKDMEDKVHNNIKYNGMLYFAHDMTIVNLLNTLGKYDMKELPDYASCLMLELIDEGAGKHSVKLYYSYSTKTQAHLLETMTLDNFVKETKKFIPSNWNEECKK